MSEDILNAMNIEFAFKYLVGLDSDAVKYLNADVFRTGDIKQIGLLLQKSADVLIERMGKIEFETWENDAGQPKMRLGMAINHLRTMGKALCELKNNEPEDYHWSIVSFLIMIIASLFDHIEGRTYLKIS